MPVTPLFDGTPQQLADGVEPSGRVQGRIQGLRTGPQGAVLEVVGRETQPRAPRKQAVPGPLSSQIRFQLSVLALSPNYNALFSTAMVAFVNDLNVVIDWETTFVGEFVPALQSIELSK